MTILSKNTLLRLRLSHKDYETEGVFQVKEDGSFLTELRPLSRQELIPNWQQRIGFLFFEALDKSQPIDWLSDHSIRMRLNTAFQKVGREFTQTITLEDCKGFWAIDSDYFAENGEKIAIPFHFIVRAGDQFLNRDPAGPTTLPSTHRWLTREAL